MLRVFLSLVVLSGVAAWSGGWYSLYGCHPPHKLRARVELASFDNDRDFNGVVNGKDFPVDLIEYDYDGNTADIEEWEVVFHWRCRYGWDEDFGRYFYNTSIRGLTPAALAGFSMTGAQFRQLQVTRFQTYCTERNNKPKDCWRLQAEAQSLKNFGDYSLPESAYAAGLGVICLPRCRPGQTTT